MHPATPDYSILDLVLESYGDNNLELQKNNISHEFHSFTNEWRGIQRLSIIKLFFHFQRANFDKPSELVSKVTWKELFREMNAKKTWDFFKSVASDPVYTICLMIRNQNLPPLLQRALSASMQASAQHHEWPSGHDWPCGLWLSNYFDVGKSKGRRSTVGGVPCYTAVAYTRIHHLINLYEVGWGELQQWLHFRRGWQRPTLY